MLNDSKDMPLVSNCTRRAQSCLQEALELLRQLEREPLPVQNYREELCSGAVGLHRGYYCPSLVRDIICGNVKRGKILKRPTKRSKPTNRYLFDDSGKLRVVETFGVKSKILGGEFKFTEYLFYYKDRIIGVTVKDNKSIKAVSEEQYAEGKIQDYMVAYFSCWHGQGGTAADYRYNTIDYEQYSYDSVGLLDSAWFTITPSMNSIYGFKQRFIRENGYLKQYYSIDTPEELANPKVFYNVWEERKA